MIGGYMGKVLEVDLASNRVKKYALPDRMLELYVGNKGLGARLLYDLLPPSADPLTEKNVFIVTTAPLTGSGAPSSNRFNITTKSPLTGAIVNSNCGGDFGIHLKRAGYDALIITGKARRPVYLKVDGDDVSIEDAAELWGLDTQKTQEKLPAGTGKIVIGPAGENLVKFASVISEERVAARGGVGAVMGSKNLKAVIAGGDQKVRVAHEEKFKNTCKKWRELSRRHPATGEELPRYGTAAFVNKCNATYTLPTRNFRYGTFSEADAVSGETLAEKYLVKNIGCRGCPVACGRQVELNGKKIKGPEYETVGLLGPNIMNADLSAIIEFNYQADLLGLDTISLGNTLGFVMEAGEKGLLITDLAFGKTSGISRAIEDIAYRRGLGDDMAEGVRFLSKKYGGEEFAIHVKGLEIASYEPRGAVGQGLGYAIASRGGCHIAAGYPIYLEANGPITVDPHSTIGKPGLVILNQTTMEAVSSLGCCIFTVYMFLPRQLIEINARSRFVSKMIRSGFLYGGNLIGRALSLPAWTLPVPPPFFMLPQVKAHAHCTGRRFTLGRLMELGKRVVNMDRIFNLREGLTAADDTLPARLTEELQRSEEPNSRVPLAKMLPKYYQFRGWSSDGVPRSKTLKALSIEQEPSLPGAAADSSGAAIAGN
ncbi:MAG TPA: aldehyde ferredoxin oxidoreductase family protein [Bacillota bacterium]|jgi:aldehyde:ferredoxin oxidoreductase|nr:aldehyde ferredoxin oxidoreductase family protein [Bacillota bacterium]HOA36109.1 aldehyde ferredoxin oxidoreductase family protein [Bacillota bacterium]HOJ83421.1 aldehyde ferredoxin oxidoreductase family protein [Bacillota bacterium]HOL14642.1 aldehyde ferredoxin oxidoreductase family protein [Bacillota bacterium]HPZ12129.1 aldehyde ferredoxin oxidoreductase family protein [Bacillota bacterium]